MEHPPRTDCARTSFKAIRLFIALACSLHRLTYSSVLGASFYFYWGENFLFSRHFISAHDVALCACVSDVNKLQKWHQTSNRSKNSWFDRRGNSRCLRNFFVRWYEWGESFFSARDNINPSFYHEARQNPMRCDKFSNSPKTKHKQLWNDARYERACWFKLD